MSVDKYCLKPLYLGQITTVVDRQTKQIYTQTYTETTKDRRPMIIFNFCSYLYTSGLMAAESQQSGSLAAVNLSLARVNLKSEIHIFK